MSEEFVYVIGRKWRPDEPFGLDNRCIYYYGTESHTGTFDNAKALLEYVRSQDKDKAGEYKIYRVTYNEVDTNE